jgi:hypothetical protein
MKNLTFIFIILMTLGTARKSSAQTLLLVKEAGTVKMKINVNNVPKIEPPEALRKIRPARNLRFDFSGLPDNAEVKIYSKQDSADKTEITNQSSLIKKDGKQFIFQKTDPQVQVLIVSVQLDANSEPVTFDNIGADLQATQILKTDTNKPKTYGSWRDFLSKNRGNYIDIIKGRKRYFSEENIAYICLDPFGNIIGKKPVNLDQDDDIIILMVVPNSDEYDNYSINDNDAEYAPNGLSMPDEVEIAIQSGDNGDMDYAIKLFDKGPYTSSDVTFTAMRGTTMLSNTTVHINPFYHLNIGVGYVSSSLESPDYQVIPLSSTTNTIKAVNGGRRTFLTINAIWYWWSTFRYFISGSDITRGRDLLKEPDFLTRINPTFGIGLKGNLENNFFTGFNFEFARGGSISAGWHYGKVSRLLDESFRPGETEFTGTQTDIKTFEKWKWGGYFGIILDTRIFNRLFSPAKTSSP